MNTKYKTFIESLPVSHKHKVIVESAINNYSHFNHNGIKNKQYISFLESKVVDSHSASLVEAIIRGYSVTHSEILTEGFKDVMKNIGNRVKGVFQKNSPSDNYIVIGWGVSNTLVASLKGDTYTIESVNGTKSLAPGMQFSANSIPTKGEKMSLNILGKGVYNSKDIIYDVNKGSKENMTQVAHMHAKYNKNKELHRQEDSIKTSNNTNSYNSVTIKWGNNSLSANFDKGKSKWVITNVSGTKNLSIGDVFSDKLPEINGKMSIQIDGKGTYNGSQSVSAIDFGDSNESVNSDTKSSTPVSSGSIVTINWGNNSLSAKYNKKTDKWTVTNINGTKNIAVGDVFSNKLPTSNGKMSIQFDGKGIYNGSQTVSAIDIKPPVKKPTVSGDATVKKPVVAPEGAPAPAKKPVAKKPVVAPEGAPAPVKKPVAKKPVVAPEGAPAPTKKPTVKKQPIA